MEAVAMAMGSTGTSVPESILDRAAFQMGSHTPRVPMRMHKENRDRVVDKLAELSPELDVVTTFLLVHSGEQQCHNDTDHELLFRPESNFNYLFGVHEPDIFGAVHLGTKRSVLFIPRLAVEYAVWLGEILPPSHFRDKYAVDDVRFHDEMAAYFAGEHARTVLVLKGYNLDGKKWTRPAHFKGIESFTVNDTALYPAITACRVIKSSLELQLLREINKISSAAHREVMRRCKPGMYEWELESIFLHETYGRGGCRFVSYTCICASGKNSAVLHYGHAGAPNDRRIADGDLNLFDMGAMYHGYCSDITCTFPANGKFTPQQRAIYLAVLDANRAVLRATRPGVRWTDMHVLAERVILEHLARLGLVRGDVDAAVKARVGAVFMPHGLGHFLGCDTHDVGGYLDPAERSTEPGLCKLRTNRVLEPGMVITIEPGCYFIDVLLDAALANPKLNVFLDAAALTPYRGMGGVRIEDDVIVTPTGAELMTDVPRTPEEIEAWMAGEQA